MSNWSAFSSWHDKSIRHTVYDMIYTYKKDEYCQLYKAHSGNKAKDIDNYLYMSSI